MKSVFNVANVMLLAVVCSVLAACASAPTPTADQAKLAKAQRVADRLDRHARN